MLIIKIWPKAHIKYLKLWRLNLLAINIESLFLLNRSIQVVIFLLRNIGLLLKNIQQQLQKLTINISVQLKQKNMSSKILTCYQAITYFKENLLMRFVIQNERNKKEQRKR
jgi:hypothetical protein